MSCRLWLCTCDLYTAFKIIGCYFHLFSKFEFTEFNNVWIEIEFMHINCAWEITEELLTKELSVSKFIPGYVVTGLSSAGGCAVLLRGLINARRCTSTSVEFLDQHRRHKPYSFFFAFRCAVAFWNCLTPWPQPFAALVFFVDFHPKCRSWRKKSGSVHQRVWNTSSWPMMTLFLGRTWKLWTCGKTSKFFIIFHHDSIYTIFLFFSRW